MGTSTLLSCIWKNTTNGVFCFVFSPKCTDDRRVWLLLEAPNVTVLIQPLVTCSVFLSSAFCRLSKAFLPGPYFCLSFPGFWKFNLRLHACLFPNTWVVSEASQLSKMATNGSQNSTFSGTLPTSVSIHPILYSPTNKETHRFYQTPGAQEVEGHKRSSAGWSSPMPYNFSFYSPISGVCLAQICTKLNDNCTKDRVDALFPHLRPHPWKSGFNGPSAYITAAEMGPCGTRKQQLGSFQTCDVLWDWQKFHVQG